MTTAPLTCMPANVIGNRTEPDYSAGFSKHTVRDPIAHDNIKGAVWYPTKAREARVPELNRMFRVARDALPARGEFPLVVLSHGSGGWFGAHHDTAEYLARRGYLVLSVTHPGDNYEDLSGYLGAEQLIGRPRHLKLFLDYVLDTHKYGGIVDRTRIAAMGFAAGGYAVMALIGARPDFENFHRHAERHPTDPTILPHWELTLATLPEDVMPQTDNRIAAAVLMAPAFGFLFDADSLARVSASIQLHRAEMDQILSAEAHIEPYLHGIPTTPEYRIVKGAGHYAFLAPCPDTMLEEDSDICKDRQGFDRTAFHERLNQQIHDFFRRVLHPERSAPYALLLDPAIGSNPSDPPAA